VSVSLLDVNVLVALAWPNHVHHERAHAWFRAARRSGWATCPATQSGFIRVSSNRRVVPEAPTPTEARALLQQMVAIGAHEFWPDDVAPVEPGGPFDRVVGYRQVSDAHLLALVMRRRGRLATFDRSVRELVPPGVKPAAVLDLLE
jgi:uncharacterized protein